MFYAPAVAASMEQAWRCARKVVWLFLDKRTHVVESEEFSIRHAAGGLVSARMGAEMTKRNYVQEDISADQVACRVRRAWNASIVCAKHYFDDSDGTILQRLPLICIFQYGGPSNANIWPFPHSPL
jgi:hypothetical protein